MALPLGSIIGRKAEGQQYKILKHLGEGSFGNVYEAVNTSSGEIYAVKVQDMEFEHDRYCSLDYERDVLKRLSGIDGVPEIHHFGKDASNAVKYIVTSVLNASLHQVLRGCGGRFTTETTLNLALKLLTILENVHTRGFIHRDLKPVNLMVGGDKLDKVFVIDYGLSKKFTTETGEHVAYEDDLGGLSGNWWTSSVNAHRGIEQSRRDDLIALGYNFVLFLKGNLPWFELRDEPRPAKYEKVGDMKEAYSPELLCEGLPKEFLTYFEYCNNLMFQEDPDYVYLRGLFENLFCHLNKGQTFHYDWVAVDKMEPILNGDHENVGESEVENATSTNTDTENIILLSRSISSSSNNDLKKSINSTSDESSEDFESPSSSASSSPETASSKLDKETCSSSSSVEQVDEPGSSSLLPLPGQDRTGFWIRGPIHLPGTTILVSFLYFKDELIGWTEGTLNPSNPEGQGGSNDDQTQSTHFSGIDQAMQH